MLKALIVEDTPEEATALRHCLEAYGQEHGLEFEVEWTQLAINLVKSQKRYDVIFLDIEIPGINGMEAAELVRLRDTATPIIFVTNLAQHAVKSYEVNAAGYIVKPVTLPKLALCMDKISGKLRRAGAAKLAIPTSGGLRALAIDDISYIELVRHDLIFHLASDEEPVKLRGTIKQVLEQVDEGSPLLQVSSGCVVNMDYVRLIHGSEVRMADGTQLPLSRARRKAAVEAFSAFLGRSH
jgi:DNA-binding LytR/AlgR family response regulator